MEANTILLLLFTFFILQKVNNKFHIIAFIINKVVFSNNATFKQLIALNKEYIEIKKEQDKISAQDQYGKWTKLNRKLDDITAKKKTLTSKIEQTTKENDAKVKKIENFIIKYPFLGLKMYYGKTLIFQFEHKAAIARILPDFLEQICTVGFTGIPITFIKMLLSFIRNDSNISEFGYKKGNGVSIGILFYCLESVISEFLGLFSNNVFSRIEVPESLKEGDAKAHKVHESLD